VAVGIAFELVGEAVAGTAAAGAGGVAALDHEVGDDAVEDGAVVELVAGEEDEVADGVRRFGGEELTNNCAARRFERGGVLLGRINRHRRRGWILFHIFSV
jgi:hypothetical protein